VKARRRGMTVARNGAARYAYQRIGEGDYADFRVHAIAIAWICPNGFDSLKGSSRLDEAEPTGRMTQKTLLASSTGIPPPQVQFVCAR